jgi:hypothetical protein
LIVSAAIDWGRSLSSERLLENHQSKGVTMTIISSAQDPTDRHDHLTEAQIGSPPHVIEFFTAGEQMFTESSGSVEPSKPRVISQMESSLLTQSRL